MDILEHILKEFKKNKINKFIPDYTYYNRSNGISDIKRINENRDDEEFEVLFFNFKKNKSKKQTRPQEIELMEPEKSHKKFKHN